MSGSMTIQAFSVRTGLPPSTLRFYEKEGLIKPNIRGENGYRLYSKEQIVIAQTIHSLRQADVNLRDIRQYLIADELEKDNWMRKWRKEVDTKMASLRVARQYLHGIEPEDQHIRLVKWEAPVRMLWCSLCVDRRPHPFSKAIEEKALFLQQHAGVHCNSVFVQTEQIKGNEIAGKIGFRLPSKCSIPDELVSELQIELQIIEPTLFVTLECIADDPYACFNLMLLLQTFGFEPSGPKMEHYELCDMSSYHWMVPVLQASNYL